MKIGKYTLPDNINILGTEYKINYRNETDPKLKGNDGYIETCTKEIIIDKKLFESVYDSKIIARLDLQGLKVLRHEIIHAFIYESGLWENSEWARNEEMTDWIAIQFPKINKLFNEIGVNK